MNNIFEVDTSQHANNTCVNGNDFVLENQVNNTWNGSLHYNREKNF